MASSKTRNSHRPQNHAAESQESSGTIPEKTREQLAFADDWMAQMFHISEALQRAQQQFSQRAAVLHSQAAENLRSVTTPAELAQVQANLLMTWSQEFVRFLQDMTLIAVKLGSETLQQGRNDAEVQETAAAETATSAARAAMNAAAPMMRAWQMFLTAPLEAGWTRH